MLVKDGRIAGFKAYDYRGRVPQELDEELARLMGRAMARVIKPRRVVVGHDMRLSSEAMSAALTEGLVASGVDVADIGLCGTEQIYFATSHLEADGGVMITASHNPEDYNGMKFVQEGSRPISCDTGLREIEAEVLAGGFTDASTPGRVEQVDVVDAYLDHLMGYIDADALAPMKVLFNPGNGCAGSVTDRLLERLPGVEAVRMMWEADGTFPNGVPNPLLHDNRSATSEQVKAHGAQLGVAWDGDFDRCFFFDENGDFVEGYYIVGLLAVQMLSRAPGAKIIHDPRVFWNTIEVINDSNGVPFQSKSGHAFIKQQMRAEDVMYGGEMSAHHYFKDFFYCDSGMIPWLLMLELLTRSGKTLSQLVSERVQRYPISGELNRHVPDPQAALDLATERYGGACLASDTVDGVSFEFEAWRFNLRKSNTEPVVRLNLETRGDTALLQEKTDELLGMLAELEVSQ